MLQRNTYEVQPTGGSWRVRKTRGPAAAYESNHNTKDVAIDAGRRVAKQKEPSQLVIKRADGTIETEYTYGKDPYPPVG